MYASANNYAYTLNKSQIKFNTTNFKLSGVGEYQILLSKAFVTDER